MPVPLRVSGSGALPPLSLARTSRLRLRFVLSNSAAPPPGCRLDRGFQPPPSGLLADLSLRSKLVDQAPYGGSPGMLPAGPGQLPARLANLARATGSARLARLCLVKLQVPPGSLAMQLDYQAACILKLKPHTLCEFKLYAA